VDSGLYAACAGLRAQSQALEVAAHNLANLNTSGFSPTIGIIGAVLGLIQVMQHLDKIDEVGKGIAVAFVATLYGVGAANLVLLPAAGKLRIRIREEQIIREMTIEGVISILEGMNPRMLEEKLLGFSLMLVDPRSQRGPTYDPPQATSQPLQPRALAGLLRRLHHAAVCILCRALRLVASRQEKSGKTGVGHSGRLPGDGSL